MQLPKYRHRVAQVQTTSCPADETKPPKYGAAAGGETAVTCPGADADDGATIQAGRG